MRDRSHRLRAAGLAALACSLTACQGVPLRSAPPPANPVAPTPVPASTTTPAVVEATVTAVPLGKTRVVYRVAFTVPKGVDSVSVVLPELASLPPAPAPASAPGEAQECSGGFFSCSKRIAETVSAIVAAIVALFGLIQLLRKKRRGKR